MNTSRKAKFFKMRNDEAKKKHVEIAVKNRKKDIRQANVCIGGWCIEKCCGFIISYIHDNYNHVI